MNILEVTYADRAGKLTVGDKEINGNLEVKGDIVFEGELEGGDITSTTTITAEGGMVCESNMQIDGNLTIDGEIISDNDISTSGDITANTLTQTNANWSAEFAFPLEPANGLKFTNVYNRFEVINNVLYVICNIKVYNPTASSVNIQYICDTVLELPEEIALKVIDFAGNSVAVNGQAAWITSIECTTKETNNTVPTAYGVKSNANLRLELYNNGTPNKVTINIAGDSTIGFSAGKAAYITARCPLTLI